MQSWPAPSKSSKDEGRYKLLALSQSRFSSMDQMMTSDSNMQMSMLQNTQSYEEMEAPDSVIGQEHKSTDENPLEFPKHALTNSTPSCVVESQSEDTRQLFEFESPSDIINTKVLNSLHNVIIDIQLPSTNSAKPATIEKLNSSDTDGIRNSRTYSEALRDIECSMKPATECGKASESLSEIGERKNRRIKRKKHRPRVKRDIATKKSKRKQKGNEEKEGPLEGHSSRVDGKKTSTKKRTILAISFLVRKKRTFKSRPRFTGKVAENTVLHNRELIRNMVGLCNSMNQLSISTVRETSQQDRGHMSSELSKEYNQSLMDVRMTNPGEEKNILLPNYTPEFTDNNKLDLDTALAIVQVPTSNCLEKELTSQNETCDQCSMHTAVPSFRSTKEEAGKGLEVVVYNQKREMILAKSAKTPVKLRARVQMDIENERIWPRLALGGIPQEFEDHQYWEKERGMMKERVELFIQRMQVVQGHRRFSPWEGSIVDSVVGAFLTQNVSDHLSSSAFMSVASRYPAIKRKDTEEAHLQGMITSSSGMDQEDVNVQLEQTSLNTGEYFVSNDSAHSTTKNVCQKLQQTHNEELNTLEEGEMDQKAENVQVEQKSLSKEEYFVANDSANSTTTNVSQKLEQIQNEELKTLVDGDLERNDNTFLNTDACKFSLDLSPVKEHMDPKAISSTPDRNLLPADIITCSHHKQIGLQNTSALPTELPSKKAEQILHESADICISMGSVEYRHLSELNHGLVLDGKHQPGIILSDLCNDRDQCAMKDGETATSTKIHEGLGDIKDYCRDVEDKTEEGWQTGWQRTEVYAKSHVRRNLFKFPDLTGYADSKNNLNYNHPFQSVSLTQENHQQESIEFNTVNIQQNEDINKESKGMPAFDTRSLEPILGNGSEFQLNQLQEPKNTAQNRKSSPSLLGKRRGPLITGMERAHFEENQNGRKKNHKQDWESMRKQTLDLHDDTENICKQSPQGNIYQDSVNWEAVHHAKVEDLADTIKERGMHHVLSGRIKAFLKTVRQDHGCIDLEWLRKITPEEAKYAEMEIL